MTEGSFVPLAGSNRETLSGVQDAGPVDESERIEVTLVLRRRAELPAGLVTGPDTISTDELAASYGTDPADIDRAREILAGYGLEVTSTHPGFPPDQGRRHRGPAGRGVRGDAAPRFQPGPGRYRAGGAPLPARQPGDPGRAGRDRDRGPGAGQPAAGKPAFPAVRGGRDTVLVHATAGGAGLRLPGGHGRDRPDDRHPRIRRRFRGERPAGLLLRPRPPGPVDHGRERRRGVQRARTPTRAAPTARCSSISRWPARWPPARRRWCTSRPTRTRRSSTRSVTPRTPRRPRS